MHALKILTDIFFFFSIFFLLLHSAIKENKNASEIVKTVNLLITSLSTDFLWDYMTKCFEDCFRCLLLNNNIPLHPLKMLLNRYLYKIIKKFYQNIFW